MGPGAMGTVTGNHSTVIRGAEHGGPESRARRPWERSTAALGVPSADGTGTDPRGQRESAGHALGLEPGRFRRPRGRDSLRPERPGLG
jgi:hypothetical protein